ncbi:hypothetical protein EYC80_006030 [Monilinia laxa]|uniref:Uncharacterized protein n=1 Tax=Monilinia laxa TaxID=61186 RepID=A0A5N6KFW4_MONLA|nr:hypothetical protein EYC80_006030 [Monilinia laxa]
MPCIHHTSFPSSIASAVVIPPLLPSLLFPTLREKKIKVTFLPSILPSSTSLIPILPPLLYSIPFHVLFCSPLAALVYPTTKTL